MLRDIHQLETFHCRDALNCRHLKEYHKDLNGLIMKSVTDEMYFGVRWYGGFVWLLCFVGFFFRNALKYKIKTKQKKLKIHALPHLSKSTALGKCVSV